MSCQRLAAPLIVLMLMLSAMGCATIGEALRSELGRGVVQDALRCADAARPAICMGIHAADAAIERLIAAAEAAQAAESGAGASSDADARAALRELRSARKEIE